MVLLRLHNLHSLPQGALSASLNRYCSASADSAGTTCTSDGDCPNTETCEEIDTPTCAESTCNGGLVIVSGAPAQGEPCTNPPCNTDLVVVDEDIIDATGVPQGHDWALEACPLDTNMDLVFEESFYSRADNNPLDEWDVTSSDYADLDAKTCNSGSNQDNICTSNDDCPGSTCNGGNKGCLVTIIDRTGGIAAIPIIPSTIIIIENASIKFLLHKCLCTTSIIISLNTVHPIIDHKIFNILVCKNGRIARFIWVPDKPCF